MMSMKVGMLLFACLTLTTGAAMLAAPAQSRPGEATQARVWIENRAAGEAIPVVIQNTSAPMRVQVTEMPVVTTRVVRQPWEYQAITIPAGQNPANVLATVGIDGWEAVGALQSNQPGTALLLKRPR